MRACARQSREMEGKGDEHGQTHRHGPFFLLFCRRHVVLSQHAVGTRTVLAQVGRLSTLLDACQRGGLPFSRCTKQTEHNRIVFVRKRLASSDRLPGYGSSHLDERTGHTPTQQGKNDTVQEAKYETNL